MDHFSIGRVYIQTVAGFIDIHIYIVAPRVIDPLVPMNRIMPHW